MDGRCRTAARAVWGRSRRSPIRRGARVWRQTATAPLTLLRGVDLLLDFRAIDAFAVAGERALPRLDRICAAILLQPQIAQVFLDDGILRHPPRRVRERSVREIELA